MINELGWSSLLKRREWAKLKVIFKAYKGFRIWEEITNRFQEPSYLGRAGHRKNIRKPRFLKNIGLLSFVGLALICGTVCLLLLGIIVLCPL